ncbi:MAG: alpha-N-arabinofuranosidase [Sphingomonas sp.]|nr:MAG: alpha-N-arabinofuranosidase [Sphingomonas sp.]
MAGAAAASAPAETPVQFLPQKAAPTISRDIFGQFAEHLGTGIYDGVWVGKDSAIPNVRGIRSDVVAALRAIHVPNVRWPGGCFADEYHWRDGIGPAAKRTVTVNSNWGGVPEPNTFGTDEFMDFIGQIGSEAYVSVNVGSGSPEEAAKWLEYMTTDQPTTLARERAANGHSAPYKVKYLGIGNENWGCGGAYSPDHYVEEMKRFSHFVKNLNPAQKDQGAMQRIAVGWDADKGDYTEAVMKAWANKAWSWDINGVSLHSYTVNGWPPHMASTGFGEDDYAKIIKETLGMDTLIAKQSAIMDKYDPEKKVALVVDEWGSWLAPTPGSNPGFLQQQNSLRDAILAAVNFNIFIRHADRVRIANIAQMVNVLQAMILTDGPKMILTPTYHIHKMYLPFQDATFVPITYEAGRYEHAGVAMPQLDAVAARDKAGKLWLAVTNIDASRPGELKLDTTGLHIRRAAGTVLTADRVDAVNDFTAPNAVMPRPIAAKANGSSLHLTVPPKSVTVIALES